MPKCSLKNCKNITSRKQKKDGISYFRFPRDPVRCEEWISIISQQRREDFYKPNNSSVVCSDHFLEEDMYVSLKGIIRLRKTAVPNVLGLTPSQDHKTIGDYLKIEMPDDGNDTEVDRTSSMFNLQFEEKFKPPIPTSVSTDEEESGLDTPREVRMKNELHKCRKRLISKEKIINNLRKKNSRLLKKTISLKNVLNVLTKRFKLERNWCKKTSLEC